MKHPLARAAVSGLLLALCLPNFDLGFLAWAALIPLLFAVERSKSTWQSWGCGFVCGLVFYAVSLHWLTYVSLVGWVFMVILESVFLMFFAGAVARGRGIQSPILKSLWTGLAWMSLEVLRAEIPVFGFG